MARFHLILFDISCKLKKNNFSKSKKEKLFVHFMQIYLIKCSKCIPNFYTIMHCYKFLQTSCTIAEGMRWYRMKDELLFLRSWWPLQNLLMRWKHCQSFWQIQTLVAKTDGRMHRWCPFNVWFLLRLCAIGKR